MTMTATMTTITTTIVTTIITTTTTITTTKTTTTTQNQAVFVRNVLRSAEQPIQHVFIHAASQSPTNTHSSKNILGKD